MDPTRHPGARIAWLVIASLLAAGLLGIGTLQVVGLLAHEERDETATVAAESIALLDVDSDGGQIEVVGTERPGIRIRARVSDGLRPTSFTHRVIGDRLEVRVRCPHDLLDTWCRTALVIEVPRALDVQVSSDSDRISVTGIDGSVTASSSDGSVEAIDIGGDVHLQSDNGAVRGRVLRASTIDASSENGSVEAVLLEPPTSVLASSQNGSVEVVLPPGDELYRVDIDSDHGSTTNEVRTDPASDRTIDAQSDNGSVTVRYLR